MKFITYSGLMVEQIEAGVVLFLGKKLMYCGAPD